jgi:hypothetical protein
VHQNSTITRRWGIWLLSGGRGGKSQRLPLIIDAISFKYGERTKVTISRGWGSRDQLRIIIIIVGI